MGTAVKAAPAANGSASALPPQFKSFNRVLTPSIRGAEGVLSLSVNNSGNWRLSTMLAELMKLKSGAGLSFHFDDSQENWYIERDDKNGFVLREDQHGVLQFNSARLRKTMQKQFPEDKETGRMLVKEEPERVGTNLFYLVITASLVTRTRS